MEKYVSYCCPGPIVLRADDEYDEFDDEDDDDQKIISGKQKSDIPYFLNPFDITNTAFMTSFFNVGIAICFLNIPVSYYLIKSRGISATQYSAYTALLGIPWSLKFIFGITSDAFPILKYRRKSYFIIVRQRLSFIFLIMSQMWLFTVGWLGYIAVNFILAYLFEPGVILTMGLMLLMTCFFMLADVTSDTMAVERSKFEKEIIRGSLQTSAYTLRSFGTVIGSLLGALLYNIPIYGWGLMINECFFLSGLIPLVTIMPATGMLEELAPSKRIPTLRIQLEKLWEVLQLRAVYQPVGYIFFYGIFQIPNGGFTTFLLHGLKFSNFEYGMLTVAGCVLAWVGMILYRKFFFDSSWRQIYIITTLLGSAFSLLQIILILQLNVLLGIPNFYFALGDYAAAAIISGIQCMPCYIMFSMLCPEGSEGLVFAVLTTISNLSGSVASDFGSLFTLIWDVSNDTIQKGDYSGVLKIAVLTSLLQMFPLCLVWLLPASKSEQMKMCNSGESSALAGTVLTAVLLISLLGSIIVSIVLIWQG